MGRICTRIAKQLQRYRLVKNLIFLGGEDASMYLSYIVGIMMVENIR